MKPAAVWGRANGRVPAVVTPKRKNAVCENADRALTSSQGTKIVHCAEVWTLETHVAHATHAAHAAHATTTAAAACCWGVFFRTLSNHGFGGEE